MQKGLKNFLSKSTENNYQSSKEHGNENFFLSFFTAHNETLTRLNLVKSKQTMTLSIASPRYIFFYIFEANIDFVCKPWVSKQQFKKKPGIGS